MSRAGTPSGSAPGSRAGSQAPSSRPRTPSQLPGSERSFAYAVGTVADFELQSLADEGKSGEPRTLTLSVPSVNSGAEFTIQLFESVGRGAFGTVYRARSSAWSGDIAVKVSAARKARLVEEIVAMARTTTLAPPELSQYVARFFFGGITTNGNIGVIGMELCVPVTLHEFLMAQYVKGGVFLRVAHQLLSAVAAVHEAGCVHRDIKMHNFVFSKSGDLRLIDFGLAASSHEPPAGDTVAGTVSFMAPEMAHNALNPEDRVSVGSAADTWSLGITLFSVLTRRTPYPVPPDEEQPEDQQQTTKRLLRRVAGGDWRWPAEFSKSNLPRAVEMVESMLQLRTARRPRVASVLRQYHSALAKRVMAPPSQLTAFLQANCPAGMSDWVIADRPFRPPLVLAVPGGAQQTAVARSTGTTPMPLKSILKAASSAPQQDSPAQPVPASQRTVKSAKGSARPTPAQARKGKQAAAASSSSGAQPGAAEVSQHDANVVAGAAAAADASSPNQIDFDITASMLDVGDDSPLLRKAVSAAAEALSRVQSRAGSPSLAGTSAAPPRVPERPSAGAADQGLVENPPRAPSIPLSGRSSNTRGPSGAASMSQGLRQPSRSAGAGKRSAPAPTPKAAAKTAQAAVVASSKKQQTTRKAVGGKQSKPAPEAQPATYASRPQLERHERQLRRIQQSLINLQLQQLQQYIRELEEQQDIERYEIEWAAENGAAYLKDPPHPNNFKDVRAWPKGYDSGFTCDSCQWQYLPDPPADKAALRPDNPPLFWHCASGMDLCLECYATYVTRRTCMGCGRVFKNLTQRGKHRCAATVVTAADKPAASEPAAAPTAAATATGKRGRTGTARESTAPQPRTRQPPAPEPAQTQSSKAPSAAAKKKATAKGGKPEQPATKGKKGAAAAAAGRDRTKAKNEGEAAAPSTTRRSKREVLDADFDGPPLFPEDEVHPEDAVLGGGSRGGAAATFDDAGAEDGRRSATPLQGFAVDADDDGSGANVKDDAVARLSGTWDPYASDRWRKGRSSTLLPDPRPTRDEQQVLTDDDWVKWVRHYSDHPNLPDGLAYHVQPGRTGCIWASNEFRAHSTVFSSLEQRMLIVDRIDATGADERRDILTSPSGADTELDVRWYKRMLQSIAVESANSIKARRAPGLMSALQPRQHSPRCDDDEQFVYVRAARIEPVINFTMLRLSNGRTQVLTHEGYDLRFVDPTRIFLCRASGECEAIDLEKFAHRDAVVRLLFSNDAVASEYLSPL